MTQNVQEALRARRGRLPRPSKGPRARRAVVADLASDFAEDAPILDVDAVEGADKAAEKVAYYLEDVHDSPEIEGDVTLRLTQLGMGAKSPVDTWVMKQDDDYNEMAETVVARAVDDILDIGLGKVKYEVRGFIEGKPLTRRVGFTLEIDRDLDDDVDEPANERGVLSQMMRHSETMMRTMKEMVVSTTQSLRAQVQEQGEELREMRRQDVEGRKVFGEMMQQRHLMEIEVRKADRDDQRKDQVVGKLVNVVAPAIAAKFLGPGISEKLGGTPPAEDMFMTMMRQMTPAQLQGIFHLLNEEQQAVFNELMRLAIEREEAAEAKKKGEGGGGGSAPPATP